MNWFDGIVVFLIVWWVVLFITLPFGIEYHSDEERDEGHIASAPKNPMIVKKMLITTVLTSILWTGIYFAIDSGMMNFREEARVMAEMDAK